MHPFRKEISELSVHFKKERRKLIRGRSKDNRHKWNTNRYNGVLAVKVNEVQFHITKTKVIKETRRRMYYVWLHYIKLKNKSKQYVEWKVST